MRIKYSTDKIATYSFRLLSKIKMKEKGNKEKIPSN
jgi:hypothetical protein